MSPSESEETGTESSRGQTSARWRANSFGNWRENGRLEKAGTAAMVDITSVRPRRQPGPSIFNASKQIADKRKRERERVIGLSLRAFRGLIAENGEKNGL